jgi:hypothetical protein
LRVCKQNDWAFLSQARLIPSPSQLQRPPQTEK